jgi:hypothetical protein
MRKTKALIVDSRLHEVKTARNYVVMIDLIVRS